MLFRKVVFILIASILIASKGRAQSYFTVKMKNVVYTSSSTDADSTIKKHYAILCNKYIQKYYHNHQLPLIYLIISTSQINTLEYELAYDNLSGYPSKYKYYGSDKEFNKSGIRIVVYSNTDKSENLLKILEYGINNLVELRRQSKTLMMKHDNTINNLALNQDKIISILKQPTSLKIKTVLEN
ncbi:hypothetical protein [Emticicia soli]|uniref:DUF4136 domain-containing protein n=1 Tax=Emticicia soli TaxID=2027878 RepID=A0ABW5JES9_9BACT